MNWFTREYIGTSSDTRKKEMIEADGACPHAEKDLSLAQFLRAERDSFGPVSTYVCCATCDAEAEKVEGEQEDVCRDCSQTVMVKDAIKWKWYDFDRRQGDEPLFICLKCKVAEKHVERVARDRADADAEYAHHDQTLQDYDIGDDNSPDDDDLDDPEMELQEQEDDRNMNIIRNNINYGILGLFVIEGHKILMHPVVGNLLGYKEVSLADQDTPEFLTEIHLQVKRNGMSDVDGWVFSNDDLRPLAVVLSKTTVNAVTIHASARNLARYVDGVSTHEYTLDHFYDNITPEELQATRY